MPIGGPETRVNTYWVNSQYGPDITVLADGGWVVTWGSILQDGDGMGVYQQAYTAGGVPLGEGRVSTYWLNDQSTPQITALTGGGWVVTWQSGSQDGSGAGVYQQAYDAHGLPQGGEVRVNTYTASNQGANQVTGLSDGGWVVTWVSDGQDGSGYGVYQQAYNADGSSQGGETRVNTYTASNQVDPQIAALSDGGWVVMWRSDAQDGSGWGVFQQAYNADGSTQGGETKVNTHTASDQLYPQMTALADGGWVVTWESGGQDGSGLGVYQQVYNGDGSTQGGEVRVNTYTASDQSNARSTALSDGGWVVTWQSTGQDGSSAGVYQQAYNADGSTRGGEARVNTYTASVQYSQQITALADGGWLVTWLSVGQDGSGTGIYQQAYNADGSTEGREQRVNTFTPNDQYWQSSVALPDGGWVVTWHSQNQDGDGFGIYQKVFHPNNAPTEITLSNNRVSEDAVDGTAIGDLIATDTDNDDVVTLSLVSNPGNNFAIVDGKLVVATGAALDFETVPSYVVTIRAEDKDGATFDKQFTIQITDDDERFQGTPDSETITGDAGDNTLYGFDGNDTLDGGTGADRMFGGFGDDIFFVDNAGDQVFENAGEGIDTVKASITFDLGAFVENLELTGNAAINGSGNGLDNVITGNGQVNKLTGGAGNDTMSGGAGGDRLIGGVGTDTLKGGAGGDWFVYKNVYDYSDEGVDNIDRITDFNKAQGDRIDLVNIDGNSVKGGYQRFDFIGTNAFSGKAGELRYEKGAALTTVMIDTNGDGQSDLTIQLDGSHNVTMDYFVI